MDLLRKIELIAVSFFLLINLFLLFGNSGITGFFVKDFPEEAPHDFISEENIIANSEGIILEIKNYTISKYSSESMIPVFDSGANGIGIKPKNEEEVHVGDIITFRQSENLIVHRVVEKGFDEEGIFFITKGDNNDLTDGKVRFSEIDSVLVALIY
ncbi:MAG: signal peptidase I [archaeon]